MLQNAQWGLKSFFSNILFDLDRKELYLGGRHMNYHDVGSPLVRAGCDGSGFTSLSNAPFYPPPRHRHTIYTSIFFPLKTLYW